jgi:hypothetical protein
MLFVFVPAHARASSELKNYDFFKIKNEKSDFFFLNQICDFYSNFKLLTHYF